MTTEEAEINAALFGIRCVLTSTQVFIANGDLALLLSSDLISPNLVTSYSNSERVLRLTGPASSAGSRASTPSSLPSAPSDSPASPSRSSVLSHLFQRFID
jgi:hypothetical protein